MMETNSNWSFFCLVGLVLLLGLTNANAQYTDAFQLYLFVYESDHTSSGAGHISMAFGKDSSDLTYYTKYRRHDGGGRKASHIPYHKAFFFDKDSLKLQEHAPTLVLELRCHNQQIQHIERLSDHWNLKEPWTLFVNNCTDAVKRVLRATKINPGLAFLISTPNELVEDLVYHHMKHFRKEEFCILEGDICFYLKNERNAVPQVLFGKRKKRNQKVESVCF
jgi:hypothetical protein